MIMRGDRTTVVRQSWFNGRFGRQTASIVQNGDTFLFFDGHSDPWGYDDLASARAAFDGFLSDKELAA